MCLVVVETSPIIRPTSVRRWRGTFSWGPLANPQRFFDLTSTTVPTGMDKQRIRSSGSRSMRSYLKNDSGPGPVLPSTPVEDGWVVWGCAVRSTPVACAANPQFGLIKSIPSGCRLVELVGRAGADFLRQLESEGVALAFPALLQVPVPPPSPRAPCPSRPPAADSTCGSAQRRQPPPPPRLRSIPYLYGAMA